MNLFVGGISWNIKEEDLKEQFEKFGTVVSVRIIMDKFTRKSKGFGFVEMSNDEEGKKAIEALNDSEMDGRKIGVNVAEEKKTREEGGDRRDFKKRDNNRW